MAAETTKKLSKVLVGGGTGFVGRVLCKTLEKHGYNVTVLSRTPGPSKLTWGKLREADELPECDAVINLAGEAIMNPLKRWTSEFQSELRRSRVETTKLLADLIAKTTKPPRVWISSSAIGYYPTSLTAEYTEDTPPPSEHTYFTQFCCDWEDSANLPSNHPSRHVVVRIGVALGRGGGAIELMIWPFWFGVGGSIGTGQQMFPWIHISDVVGIFVHALENGNISGVLNATSPQPVTNAEFTKELASAMWRPAIIPMPATAVNLMFGNKRGTMLLEGQKVIPKRTLESGYSFLFPDIKSCLNDIVK